MAAPERPLSRRQHAALDAMDIAIWTVRPGGPADRPPCVTQARFPAAGSADGGDPAAGADAGAAWDALRQAVSVCTRCRLHETRTQTVFGVGSHSAAWMVIGEAPGADEDRQGEPFVGRAGQLLNEMLRAVGLAREQVYIANVLKCRPPENRDPRPDEAASCEPYLEAQIRLLRPALILAVGRIAAQQLLRDPAPIGKLRGRIHQYGPLGTPLVVTYHPAYLLRSPREKRKAWEDLCLARGVAARGGQ